MGQSDQCSTEHYDWFSLMLDLLSYLLKLEICLLVVSCSDGFSRKFKVRVFRKSNFGHYVDPSLGATLATPPFKIKIIHAKYLPYL